MKYKIAKRYYTHSCGDGCCDEEGSEWYVNGEFVHRSPCEDNGWLAVLEHLGLEIEVVGENEEGEEIWSL